MLTDSLISAVKELLARGFEKRKIYQILGDRTIEELEEAIEIARAQLRSRDKFSRDDLWMDLEGLRYATHETVAEYRAGRLANEGVKTIADVSCGVGIQLIFYARVVSKAYGVDICRRRIKYAMENARKYGVADKIEFMVADSLNPETVGRIDADVIYSDPARPPDSPERRLEELVPSPLKIYRSYSSKTDSFIFDLPPQIRRSRVPWKGEFEYIDLMGALNRLTFYTEPLSETERRAVLLPQKVAIKSDPDLENIVDLTDSACDYIYEISPAIDRADLINELFHMLNVPMKLLLREPRRVLATGDDLPDPRYFKRIYLKVATVRFHPLRINEILRREGFGRATLRFSVAPGEYWKLRRRIEKDLRGERRAFIFRIGDKALILEEFKSPLS